ncbi:MAG: M42 family metallopeptidase [Clostridia bacterium]|nr:M42 family metallopeptidase [Clostridia bacterium]
MSFYTDLKTLCTTPSVSGREGAICDLLSQRIAPLADEVRTDAMGNLIAVKKGTGKGPSLMLCAHMDEIGFLVTVIEDNGMLRIAPVGGIHFAANAFTVLVSEKGVPGVLVPDSGTKAADYKSEKFYIDIGAKNKKEAERLVSVGDFFVAEPSLRRLCGSRVAGRPLDDRVGCAVLLSVAEALKDTALSGDVYYVFSVQEEVGCRGSKTAAFGLAPDYALCFDVTGTGDTPSASPMACSVGGGAAVKLKDSSVICHEAVVARLIELAKEKKIAYQREILLYGGTDTSSMQLSGCGSRAGALSIPTRYIHSGVELCDLKDAEACVALAVAFAEAING